MSEIGKKIGINELEEEIIKDIALGVVAPEVLAVKVAIDVVQRIADELSSDDSERPSEDKPSEDKPSEDENKP